MTKKATGVIIWLLIITMEIFPKGAVLNFNNPQSAVPIRLEYSHFDIRPFLHGNVAPFTTAMLSVLAVIFLLIYCKNENRRMLRGLKNISCMALIASLLPVLPGLHYLSQIGLSVSFLLLLAVCWCNYMIDWT